jgi:hypothetical protein
MRDTDLPEFVALLDDVAGLLRPSQPLTSTQRAMWFRALQGHTLADVRGALDAHIHDSQRGRFMPTPADVIGQLEAREGRPEADAAWAIAIRAKDEAATVVWTRECATAWAACLPVMCGGDEIGARMAFKAAYNSAVAEARRLRKPVEWAASVGHDASQRRDAITTAIGAGLLTHDALLALPPPAAKGWSDMPPDVRAKLDAVLSGLRGRLDAPSADQIERERTQALKAGAARAVQAYGAQAQEGKDGKP